MVACARAQRAPYGAKQRMSGSTSEESRLMLTFWRSWSSEGASAHTHTQGTRAQVQYGDAYDSMNVELPTQMSEQSVTECCIVSVGPSAGVPVCAGAVVHMHGVRVCVWGLRTSGRT